MSAEGTICIATADEARYTAFMLAVIQSHRPGIKVNWTRSANIAWNFNETLRSSEGDWVWILGDDHDWEPGLLDRLIADDKDIVVPLVLKRTVPLETVVYKSEVWQGHFKAYELSELPHDRLLSVWAAGTAGMLIRRRVIETLPEPWFEQRPGDVALNEDIYFCEKAAAAGFRTYLDTGAVMGHITPVTIWPRWRDDHWGADLEISTSAAVAID